MTKIVPDQRITIPEKVGTSAKDSVFTQTGSRGEILDSFGQTLGHVKFAQGLGASLRLANELRAVKQVGHLPFLKSSNLHEDVLRGNLGPGNGFKNVFGEDEETGAMSRMAYKL